MSQILHAETNKLQNIWGSDASQVVKAAPVLGSIPADAEAYAAHPFHPQFAPVTGNSPTTASRMA